jgi:YVTN family beta-propeller protein
MNKKISILGLFIAFSAILFTACKKNDSSTVNYEESVVVANRGAGSVSFIDPNSNMVTRTLSITGSEPMYVVYVAANDRLYVGDRAGKKSSYR